MLHKLQLSQETWLVSERGGVGGSECCQFAGIGEIKSESKLILDPNL